MNWKEFLKDYCTFCGGEIVWAIKYPTSDLNYYGIILKGTGKYWHSYCAQKCAELRNGGE